MSRTNSQTGSVSTEQSQITILHRATVLNREFCIYGTTENPMFLAKDVAEWIEHSNPRMMLQSVDEDEKQCVNNPYASSGQQEQWFLTEYGLYEVLMQSRKAVAKAFKKQVKTILREIRQTGSYAPQPDKSTVALLSKVCKSLDSLTLAILNQTAVQKQEAHTIPQIQYQPVQPVPAPSAPVAPSPVKYERVSDYRSNRGGRKCSLRHRITGEKILFSSLRAACFFLGLPSHYVSVKLAEGMCYEDWQFHLED